MPTGFFSMELGDDAVFRDGDILGLVPERIRVEEHDEAERVIVDFARTGSYGGSEGIELWSLPVDEAHAEGSGELIPMDGALLLSISIPGAFPRTEGPLPDVSVLADGLVRDVEYTGFEGGGVLYLGLSSGETEYRLSSKNNPYQVIIDVRSTAT